MAISAEIIDPSGTVTPITGQGEHPAGDAQAVRIAAHEDQVTLCREGDDLLVDFESGEQLRLEGFYDGETPLFYLQAQDGSYVRHTVPEVEDTCGVAAGDSGSGLLLAAAGLAGIGSILYSQTRNHAPVFDGGEDRGNVRERADGAADEHKAVLKADGELDFHDKDKDDVHKVTTKLVAVDGPTEEDEAVGRFTAEIVKDKGGSGRVEWHFEAKDSEIDYLGENQTIKQTYEVKVDDGHGGTATEEVTVIISGRNDAPEAKDITAEAKEDGPAITVKADYTDADRDDTHTFTVDASKTKGHVTVNEDGTFSYDPGHAFDYLKENETATDTFTYTVRDQHGGEDTRTVTVEITGQNDAPEAKDVAAKTTEDGPAITIRPDFTDKDKGEIHTFMVDTADTKGTVALNEDGTFAYDPGHAFDYLGENGTATDTFTYTVRDEHGAESTRTVTVNITGKNDAPEARDMAVEAKENEVIAIRPDFSDPDRNDTHTFTVDTSKTKGIVTVNEDGTFSYEAGSAFDYLKENETATDIFTYTVRDEHGAESTKTVTVNITGENDAPKVDDVSLRAQALVNNGFEDSSAFHGWNIDASTTNFVAQSTSISNIPTKNVLTTPTGNPSAFFTSDDITVADFHIVGAIQNRSDVSWGQALTTDTFIAEKGDKIHRSSFWFVSNWDDTVACNIVLTNIDTGQKYTYYTDSLGKNGGNLAQYEIEIPETGRYTVSYRAGSRDDSGDGRVDMHFYLGNVDLQSDLVGTDHEYTFDKGQFLAKATDPEGDKLDVVSVSEKSDLGARVYIGADGKIHYDATGLDNLERGKVYTDTLTYTVSDGHGGTTEATASIKVYGDGKAAEDTPKLQAANDAPMDDLSALLDGGTRHIVEAGQETDFGHAGSGNAHPNPLDDSILRLLIA